MEQGDFLIMTIQTLGLLTPTMILFYNQGKYRGKTDQVLAEHQKDINGIGSKVSSTRVETEQVLNELTAKVDSISNVLAKVTTSIEYIEKHIGRLEKKLEEA